MKLSQVGACILYISIPAVLALNCQLCTNMVNIPGFTAASSCNSQQIDSVTCGAFRDRCMTVKATVSFAGEPDPFNLEVRNCSNTQVCDPNNNLYVCKLLRRDPRFMVTKVTKCTASCCTGDLCNDPAAGISN